MLGLIIGGSGSGKSEYAENLICTLNPGRVYLATMRPGDGESRKRIEKHRGMREKKGFVTVERETDIGSVTIRPGFSVLLEDVGNLLANTMYGTGKKSADDAADIILKDIIKLHDNCADLIIVSNDVFSGGAGYDGGTKEYMKKLAHINREIAKKADFVSEIVCGLPNVIKEPG